MERTALLQTKAGLLTSQSVAAPLGINQPQKLPPRAGKASPPLPHLQGAENPGWTFQEQNSFAGQHIPAGLQTAPKPKIFLFGP